MSHEADQRPPSIEPGGARVPRPLAVYERPGTVALLPPAADKQVLDVGCGPGSLSASFVVIDIRRPGGY